MSNTVMTTAQRAVFLADIIAKQAVGQPLFGVVNEEVMAVYYNTLTTIQVERTLLTKHELLFSTSQEGTTFAWSSLGYIGRSVGERDALREMFNETKSVDPSNAQIKLAFNDIFSGGGNGALNLTHSRAMSKRLCNRVEALFATGTGTLASPAILGFEGTVSAQFISNVINGLN